MKSVKWGTAVPLIGGLSVAAKNVTGVDPAFFISYSAFGENEQNAKAYFKNTPHYLLDSPDRGGFNVSEHQDVDFINAVCPCAGLSLLSSGNQEQRSKMNYWMLETARVVTGEVRPKVFWGENAPALYSASGKSVREELRSIAEQNGYSFSIYLTNTVHHGIPQNRKRTFYFFWRDSGAPIFDYYKREMPGLAEYLSRVPADSIHHSQAEVQAATDKLAANPYVLFLQQKHQGKGLEVLRQHLLDKNIKGITLLTYLVKSGQLSEARDWLQAQGHEKHYREAERVLNKVKIEGNYWDGSYPIYNGLGDMSTLISRTLDTIHPAEDRLFTIRECMHMMGLPHDFELVTMSTNNICQNVPVNTGSDMTREVMKYVNGEAKISNSSFLMQSNLNERVDVSESSLLAF